MYQIFKKLKSKLKLVLNPLHNMTEYLQDNSANYINYIFKYKYIYDPGQ